MATSSSARSARRKVRSKPADDEIFALWNALADFSAGETDAALVHLMETLCAWTKADNAFWIGGVRMMRGAAARRDTQHGWRARGIRHLHMVPERLELIARAMREQDTDPGMTTRAIVEEAGTFRVHRLRDGFVDFDAFRRTAHWRAFYRDLRITDRIWVAFPVNEDTESYFLLDLHHPRRQFSEADAALAGRMLSGIKWFHRNLLLSHGLRAAETALAPRQRRVLSLLLSDKTEQQVATELELTPGTVHQYAVELYRKFGVKGRAGLMALWLGH